jgi:hypothetical protein
VRRSCPQGVIAQQRAVSCRASRRWLPHDLRAGVPQQGQASDSRGGGGGPQPKSIRFFPNNEFQDGRPFDPEPPCDAVKEGQAFLTQAEGRRMPTRGRGRWWGQTSGTRPTQEVGRDWQVSRVRVHRGRVYPTPPGEATHKRREPSHAPAEGQARASGCVAWDRLRRRAMPEVHIASEFWAGVDAVL